MAKRGADVSATDIMFAHNSCCAGTFSSDFYNFECRFKIVYTPITMLPNGQLFS